MKANRWIHGALLACLLACLWAPAPAQARKQVMVITQRGCEEVCRSFQASLRAQGEVEFIMRDVAGDLQRVSAIVAEARQRRPDLVATWGTSITLAVVGTHDAVDPARHLSDIPVVYMYVGSPVDSRIAVSAARSGRPNVAGANTAVPLDAQINLMQSYRPLRRVALVYNANEPAAAAQAASVTRALQARQLAVHATQIALLPSGQPDARAIDAALDAVARHQPDFLYYIGSSFTLAHIDTLSRGAVARGMPMFSALEPAYRQGDVLLGLISPLASIGQIAAFQAGRILFEGGAPGALDSPTLSRHSVLVNMRAARALRMYPPMNLLKFAEVVD